MLGYGLINEIANEYGTPCYVFNIEELRKRITDIKRILGNKIQLCYAIKANPFLVSFIEDITDRLEVCSPGEYKICEELSIKTEKIVLSGVYKNQKDIKQLVDSSFQGIYTIESKQQLKIIYESYHNCIQKPKLMLRLSSGNQFGLTFKEAIKIISNKEIEDKIDIIGVQYYSGTQKKKMSAIQKEIENLDSFCREIKKIKRKDIFEVEYGPGLYIDYFEECENNLNDMEKLTEIIKTMKSSSHITIELGRYIAAPCGTYITKAVDIKRNNDKNYCIVDGGIHHISYYGQLLGIKNPLVRLFQKEKNRSKDEWNICGSLCTVHDVLLKNYFMYEPKIGDLVCFEKCGAYSVTEASALFLSRDMPIIVSVTNNKIKKIRGCIQSYKFNTLEKD